MSSWEIRAAEEGDIGDVQGIAGRTIKACFPAFLGEEQAVGFVESGLSDREIAEHRDNLFVMSDQGRIVGFSIILGDLIHLMMVDVALHRSGYGSLLLEWCEAEIRGRGHSVARLETFTGNVQATSFYLKNGWREIARDDDEGPLSRSYFAKRLA